MRKILIYIILSFIFSNISFAKKSGCTDGDCNNGFGTWTYTDKTTYVGDWVNGQKERVLKHGQMDMFMKVNLMTVNGMVLEN